MKKLLVVGLFCSMMVVGCGKKESPDIVVKDAFVEAASIAEDAIESIETTAVESTESEGTEIATVEVASGVDEDYVQNAVQDRQEKVESDDYIVLDEQYLGEKPNWGKIQAYNDPNYPDEVAVYAGVRTLDKDYPDIDKVLEVSKTKPVVIDSDWMSKVPVQDGDSWTNGKITIGDSIITLGTTYEDLIADGWTCLEDKSYDDLDADVEPRKGASGFFQKGDDIIKCIFFNYTDDKNIPAKECNICEVDIYSPLYWYGSNNPMESCNFNIDSITPETTLEEIKNLGWIASSMTGTEDGDTLVTVEFKSDDDEYVLYMSSTDGVHITKAQYSFLAVLGTPKVLQ